MTHDIWHMTQDLWNLTRDTWHKTCETWHVTHDTWCGIFHRGKIGGLLPAGLPYFFFFFQTASYEVPLSGTLFHKGVVLHDRGFSVSLPIFIHQVSMVQKGALMLPLRLLVPDCDASLHVPGQHRAGCAVAAYMLPLIAWWLGSSPLGATHGLVSIG